MFRRWATTLLELAGLGAIVTGVGLLSFDAGVVAAGFVALFLGWRLG
jgi:hypothetical protein